VINKTLSLCLRDTHQRELKGPLQSMTKADPVVSLINGRSEVAVILLNFNGCEDTLACLDSLYGKGDAESVIIVVDNGSTDSSVSRLEDWARTKHVPIQSVGCRLDRNRATPTSLVPSDRGKLTLIQTGANLGFAGGSNVGIRCALSWGVEYVLLLNNDAIAPPGIATQLVEVAKKENAGIVGTRICYFDEPERVWFLGGEFRWWNNCMRQEAFRRGGSNSSVLPTDWVTGCCVLVHKSVFGRIGFLDENAFFHSEDVDFCERAASAGIRRVVATGTTVYHKVSRSAGANTPFNWYHYTKSRLYFHRKHHSVLSHLAFFMLFLASRAARSVFWLFAGRSDLIWATWCAVLANGKGDLGTSRFRPAADSGGIVPK